MSDLPFHRSTDPRWERPFSAAFSSHTACFLSTQIFVLSHTFAAIETEYNFKLSVLYWSNLLSALLLVLGTIRIIPYVRRIFREQEIVVNDGPSLITELLPQFLQNVFLLLVITITGLTDYNISLRFNLDIAVIVYFFLGLVGLALAISSVTDHKERVLVATTVVTCTVHRPLWFSDYALVLPVTMAVLLLAYFSAIDIRAHKIVLTST